MTNDLALMFLTEPFEMMPHINTICLPEAKYKPNTVCVASGWGKEKFGKKGNYQVFQQKFRQKCKIIKHDFLSGLLEESRTSVSCKRSLPNSTEGDEIGSRLYPS